jgi:hypothetical protein
MIRSGEACSDVATRIVQLSEESRSYCLMKEKPEVLFDLKHSRIRAGWRGVH